MGVKRLRNGKVPVLGGFHFYQVMDRFSRRGEQTVGRERESGEGSEGTGEGTGGYEDEEGE